MAKHVGILTAGGDTPGLNAALRGLAKAAMDTYDMEVVGFYDGYRGLMENRTIHFEPRHLSGILTMGGTILGTSRDKPDSMPVGGQLLDMTDAMVENYNKTHLDALVCMGGGGTQKSALKLVKKGLNIITLPKTIDNDVYGTDVTFGFDTALGIATEAIDRLHSTAHSHHRIILVEIMGHNAGWLALGSGIAGGADVILIPEIPYDSRKIAEAILRRVRGGKRFSIVAFSEGAMSIEEAERLKKLQDAVKNSEKKKEQEEAKARLLEFEMQRAGGSMRLAPQLLALTGLEARVTILGYVQRGGTPSSADRLLATRLGTACAEYIQQGVFGVMLASRGSSIQPVPLEEVVGKRKIVPLTHDWIETARRVGTNLGD